MSYSPFDDSPLPPPTGDDFANLAAEAGLPVGWVKKRKRTPLWVRLLVTLVVGGGLAAAAVVGLRIYTDQHTTLKIPALSEMTIKECEPFTLKIDTQLSNIPAANVTFSIKNPPPGATFNEKTGELSWTPTEEQGPGSYGMMIYASADEPLHREDHAPLTIHVQEAPQPPVVAPIPPRIVKPGETVSFTVEAKDPDIPPSPLHYRVFCSVPVPAKMNSQTGEFTWTPQKVTPGTLYRFMVRVGHGSAGATTNQRFDIQIEGTAPAPQVAASNMAQSEATTATGGMYDPLPLALEDSAPAASQLAVSEETVKKAKELDITSDMPAGAAATPAAAKVDYDEELLKLFEAKKLLAALEYGAVRKHFADRFTQEHQAQMKQAWAADYDAMMEWASKQPEFWEEFCIALDPQRDDLPAALGLLRELKAKAGDKLPQFGNLAIAVAVVWDQDRKNVFDYATLQKRTKAKLPAERPGAVESFQYYLDGDGNMQNRAQFLPWEFLVYVVDHQTPLAERQWALTNYLPKRGMIGRCQADVPLDAGILTKNYEAAKIRDQEYTLANLRQFGGSRPMQADFAARVAKCLGVPAAMINGTTGAEGEQAWLLWTEISAAAKGNTAFSLQSEGRAAVDGFVGRAIDPQTGAELSDRELELRMHVAGRDPQSKRHADLAMRALGTLREKAKMKPADQLTYLNQVILLCPPAPEPWISLAKLAKEPDAKKDLAQPMAEAVEKCLRTFAAFPDFSVKLFDDLTATDEDAKHRIKSCERLVAVCEDGKRPDLAADTRLKLTAMLVQDNQQEAALEGLATTIKKFPDAQQQVPKLLDKYEDLAEAMVGARAKLLQLYQQLLPAIPKMQGDRPSRYCMDMLERGIKRFKEANQPNAAAPFEAALAELKAAETKPGK